jgi:hypothetical protein
MKKDVKQVVKYVAYANMREVKTVIDANGNNVYSFSYDEIVFGEDKNTVLDFNVRTAENVTEEYKNKFVKIVTEDLNDVLNKESQIKEFVEKKSKKEKIEKKHNVKNLEVADKQPKTSSLVRNSIIATVIVLVAVAAYNLGSSKSLNNNDNGQPLPGNTNVEVQPQVSELEQLNIDVEAIVADTKTKFEKHGILYDDNKVRTFIYLLNYETIRNIDEDHTIATKLKDDGILSSDIEISKGAFNGVAETIKNHNDVISLGSKDSTLSTFEANLIRQSDMIIDENYKSFASNLEDVVYNVRHTSNEEERSNSMELANSLMIGTKLHSGINFNYLPSSMRSALSQDLITKFVGYTSERGIRTYEGWGAFIGPEIEEYTNSIKTDLIAVGVCQEEKSK